MKGRKQEDLSEEELWGGLLKVGAHLARGAIRAGKGGKLLKRANAAYGYTNDAISIYNNLKKRKEMEDLSEEEEEEMWAGLVRAGIRAGISAAMRNRKELDEEEMWMKNSVQSKINAGWRREELDEEEMWKKGSVSTGIKKGWDAFRNREEDLDEEELLKKPVFPKMAFGWNNPFKKEELSEDEEEEMVWGHLLRAGINAAIRGRKEY